MTTPRRRTGFRPRKPCLGRSRSCDCARCVEYRRKGLERAAEAEQARRAAEARKREQEADAVHFDCLAGLTPPSARPEAPAILVLQAPAAVEVPQLSLLLLTRAPAAEEAARANLWRDFDALAERHAGELVELRKLAARCGFRFSFSLHPVTNRPEYRGEAHCPDVLSLTGSEPLTAHTAATYSAEVRKRWKAARDAELVATRKVAEECGFTLGKVGLRRGLRGSWRATGPAKLRTATAGELREAMRSDAKHRQAPAAPAEDLVPAQCAGAQAPAAPDNEPTALAAEDVVAVDEMPAGWCELCRRERPGVTMHEGRGLRLCPSCWPAEGLRMGVAA